MASTHDIHQSDDQFAAITDTMDTVASVIEGNGTECMLVINLHPDQDDGVLGGKITYENLQRAQSMLAELQRRYEQEHVGVFHCSRPLSH